MQTIFLSLYLVVRIIGLWNFGSKWKESLESKENSIWFSLSNINIESDLRIGIDLLLLSNLVYIFSDQFQTRSTDDPTSIYGNRFSLFTERILIFL